MQGLLRYLRSHSRCVRASVHASVLALASHSACSAVPRQPPSGGASVQVRDDTGRLVRLRGPARRIAALSPSNSETVFALGCGPRVVLRDRASDYPPEVRRLPATSALQLSAEHIAGFRPDLVLVSHLDPTRTAGLAAVGLTVAVFDPHSVAEVSHDVVAIGTLCGARAAAERLVTQFRERLGRIQRRVETRPAPEVYVELDASDPLKPWTVGRASFVHDLLRRAGARNVFGDLDGAAVQVSVEAVLQRSPEVILLNARARDAARMRAQLLQRPGWQRVRAVREHRVIDQIDQALLTRPGPRVVDGIERLAQLLHPPASAPTAGEGLQNHLHPLNDKR